ncbi:hypothetical protein [Blautia massiliensis (ex Liu et al. 2021)]|uniref:hypothetical protein n=1 Tax=Blautia massiliensis (ex Liu et al. 2021) TaxID=3062492 RepID=UPI003F886EFD
MAEQNPATVEENFLSIFRCQEIRQIKIGGAIQPFFTVFWRENHKKYEIKRD